MGDEITKLFLINFLEGIFIVSFFFIFILYGKTDINFLLDDIKRQRTIYLAIMTGGARIKLLEYLYDIYIRDFMSQPFCAAVKLYGMGGMSTNNSVIRNIYIDSQIIPGDVSRNHLCGKLFLAINDFLNNSTADWFIRLCDDTFINMNAFDLFFNELNQNSDPLHDKLVQGNCIHKFRRSNAYLQGGSGIVFSRFSVIELLNTFDNLTKICNYVKNDDTSIGIWLRDRKYTFRSMANRFFVGHQFIGFKKVLDIISNYSKIEECPHEYHYNPNICRSFMTNMRNIVFWHDRVKFLKFLPFAKKFISDLPSDLYFYQPGVRPKVCRSSKNLDKYFD